MKINLEPIIEAAKTANPQMPEDYKDPATGMLFCGRCNTPKEMQVSLYIRGNTNRAGGVCVCY